MRLLDRSERPTPDAKPQRILTGGEVAAVLDGAEDRYRLIFEFATSTGVRLGECLGVKWSDLDLKNRTVPQLHIS